MFRCTDQYGRTATGQRCSGVSLLSTPITRPRRWAPAWSWSTTVSPPPPRPRWSPWPCRHPPGAHTRPFCQLNVSSLCGIRWLSSERERQRDRETERQRERERERDASACMRRHRLSPWPPAGPTVSERTVVGEVRSGGVQPLPCTPLFMAMSAASAAARLSNPTSTSPPPLPPPLPAPAPAAAPASDHWLTFPSVPRCVATSAASPAAAPSGSFTASVVGRRSSRNRPFLAGRPPGDVAAPAPAPAPEGAPGRFLARRRA